MSHITILENNYLKHYRENAYLYLANEMFMAERSFDWLKFHLSPSELRGKGVLIKGNKRYKILISYSPFYPVRFDRIKIEDDSIKYNDKIHLYNDMSLCLYHPIVDKPFLSSIPLFRMIPWVAEWILFYEEWKKYEVWLGREIKHFQPKVA